jgi:hypothetical protein
VHTLNFWGYEADFELIQILLTQQPPSTFTPSTSDDYSQSACLSPVPPEFPPRLQQCTDVLQNTGFETGSPALGNFVWVAGRADGERADHGAFPYPSSGSSFGLRLPFERLYVGQPANSPWFYQDFNMPDWLIDGYSEANLSIFKAVKKEANPPIYIDRSSPGDKLYVVLRDQSGFDLTTPVELATGADDPQADDLAVDKWVAQTPDLFDSFIGGELIDVAGDSVRAYFYTELGPGNDADDPGSTKFYVDDVELEVCTEQPEPDAESGTGIISGELSMLSAGTLQRVQGVPVWAYKVDGPLHTTYTVNTPPGQDNYSFHNLEPGVYIVFAQFEDSTGLVFGNSTSVNVVADQTTVQDMLLVLGGS